MEKIEIIKHYNRKIVEGILTKVFGKSDFASRWNCSFIYDDSYNQRIIHVNKKGIAIKKPDSTLEVFYDYDDLQIEETPKHSIEIYFNGELRGLYAKDTSSYDKLRGRYAIR